jgi:hypothetical protein
MFKAAIETVAGLAVLAIVLTAQAGSAAAQSALVFGIQPSQGTANTPAGSSYFSYTLGPGSSVDDSLVISNAGSSEVILKLYAADGITSINGSTAFAGREDVRSNARSWLNATVSDVLVPASQEVAVAFQVNVPADAQPGDHVAGWVIEAPPRAGAAGGIGASIVERAGVAVVVRVPGEARPELVLGGICLNQETGSNYFEVPVRNEGNVLTRAAGTLTLTTDDGWEVFTRHADLGNVVPGDGTFLRLDAPGDPGPGKYVASLNMAQPDGRVIESRTGITIGGRKVNGCVAQAAGASEEPESGVPYLGGLPGGGTPWLLLTSLAVLLGVLMIGREIVIRRLMKWTESGSKLTDE